MIKTSYQTPELRDANDNVVQEGAFGKNTALSNAENTGWIDYVMNDLEALHDTIGDSAPTLDGNGHVVEPANLAIGDEDGVRLKTGYLKTSGGTVSGTLNIAQNLKMQDNQENVFGGFYVPASSATSQFLQLYGGETPSNNGGNLQLPSDGSWTLQAKNGTTAYNLVGGTDGTLKWRGNNLAYDSQVVHLTNNETIGGTKTYSGLIKTYSGAVTTFVVQYNDVARGETRTTAKAKWFLHAWDKNNITVGGLRRDVSANNVSMTGLYDYPQGSESGTGHYIGVGHDTNENVYTHAPTPAQSSNDNNIATTAYVTAKVANYLPITGGTINGAFAINSNYQHAIYITRPSMTSGETPSVTYAVNPLTYTDKDGNYVFRISREISRTGIESLYIYKVWGDYSDALAFSRINSNDVVFRVNLDNVCNLGQANSRWKQLFAGTTTISTSDERLKDNITDIPDAVLDAWGEVGWYQYQFKDSIAEKGETKARIHTGAIAQRIESVFNAHGLDANKYGLLCYDEWKSEPAERDEDGNIVQEARPAGNRYSLRYEEALCMEAAYQRRRADRLEQRLEAIEQRLSAVETL